MAAAPRPPVVRPDMLPAVNLPLLAGTDDLPIGVQLVGASGRDERLLRTACELVRMVAEEG
jgi:Asp-tRNA(Asn)/Glu-tRNA(Gln) amidotransferase A subunit family amidase